MDHKIFSVAQIRAVEKSAIETLRIEEFSLMQRAGEAAFAFMLKKWPDVSKICVLCGPGNNGGDGLVIAKLAHEAGITVMVRTLGNMLALKNPARQAYEECQEVNIVIEPFNNGQNWDADLIIDAVLGIGLKKEVTGDFQAAISAMNHASLPILSIDVPSGLDADLGNVLGLAVKATMTVTFIGLKRGFFTNDGPDYCGEIVLSQLHLPVTLFENHYNTSLLSSFSLKEFLLPRKKNSQKGDFGHVLILGGNHGMAGAVRLAAEAALRTGAGLVSVATRPEHLAVVLAHYPEIMCHGIEDATNLQPLLQRATVLIVGPGLGQDDWARMLLQMALHTALPKVIDADGLNLLGCKPLCEDNWVLTPHPGEAARLLGMTSKEIQQNRFAALDQLEKLGGVWVLKGAGTLIKKMQHTFICPFGNPGMASGGMGDALSGIIGSLIAQKFELIQAASLGVLLHALAGDSAAREGERGLIVSDLIAKLREIVTTCPNEADDHIPLKSERHSQT